MANPEFNDEKHWLNLPGSSEKVFFKDLTWDELVPGAIWGTNYHGWYITFSSEGRVDVAQSPKHKKHL